MSEDQRLTIFDVGQTEREEAIKSLLTGKTPDNQIRYREGRGNSQQRYVNTYYSTRQANLLTGWRWSSKCLEEKARPDWNNPIEIGAHIEVTIWDAKGNEYSHDAWGQKDVVRYEKTKYKMSKGKPVLDEKKQPIIVYKRGDIISLFDDMKAAYSDGIKKCLSYFGIADDVYGPKELELYSTDEVGEDKESEENKENIDTEAATQSSASISLEEVS
jgi:hypothetical protein